MEKLVNPSFEKIEKLIKMYGKNGFCVGSSLTWADLFIYELTNNILELESAAFEMFKEIQSVRKSVESNPRIAEYIKNRAKTGFWEDEFFNSRNFLLDLFVKLLMNFRKK